MFAWSQNRHLITGWYGIGTALSQFMKVRGAKGERLLRTMYDTSRAFRLVIDEVEKTVCTADMEIARRYAALVLDRGRADAIFGAVLAEHALTAGQILRITGEADLGLRFPAFKRRLDHVRPMLERTHALQADLFRRGIDAGVFIDEDPSFLAKIFSAMDQLLLSDWEARGMRESPETLIERLRILVSRTFRRR